MQGLTVFGRLPKFLRLKLLLWISAVFLYLVLIPPVWAASWDYTISPADSLTTVDSTNTSAEVDTLNKEIRLPNIKVPDAIAFWGSGEMDYLVLTSDGVKHYSFNGTNMVENTILNVPGLTNPLAMAAPDPYPDVVAADSSGLRHYSFSGSSLVENPALSVAGLTGVTSVGTAGNGEVAILKGSQVEHYSFNEASMVRNTSLEPSIVLTNPIDVALGSSGYDTAVLEKDRIRWFNFSGSGMNENPALAVTGLTDPKAFCVADPNGGYDISVVDGASVKQYSFTGSSMTYNSALSVTSGLTAPRAVAVRPGSYDRIILDGSEVRYYQWAGSSLVYNPSLSVSVANIITSNGYVASAVVQSLSFDPGADIEFVRVRAIHTLPDKTSVTWSVTADGMNWVKKWRVSGTAGNTVLEVTGDNGMNWSIIGTAADAVPGFTNGQLWAKVTASHVVKWKAELATADPMVTPIIATTPRGGTAVQVDTDTAPEPPVLPVYGSCFMITTPSLSWTFSDSDTGDTQSAYQVEVVRAPDMAIIIDSGKVSSTLNYYNVATSTAPDVPGPLWSSGGYQFKYRVMVWDQAGVPSEWSNYSDFCVVAFERPRIAEIISPPAGQISPDPANPTTHILITPGMTQVQLPRVKAGAKTVLLVDSIGPITSFLPTFPYLGNLSTTNTPTKLQDGVTNNPMNPAGSVVNRWCLEFWTNPGLDICPTGTVVQMDISGNSVEGLTEFKAPPYSDGVVVTEGSIYGEWSVILQGRDTT